MKRQLTTILAIALFASACTGVGAAQSDPTAQADPGMPGCPTRGEPLATTKLYIEHNATDADTGVHGLFGGEAWSELCIWDPNDRLVLMVDPQGPLNDLNVADLFFESRAPPNDEYSLAELKAAFPEGAYTVGSTDFEGTPRVGTALLTHDVLAQPNITSSIVAEDEETAHETLASPTGLVVRWDPVADLVSGD